jgi:hypothetical protein
MASIRPLRTQGDAQRRLPYDLDFPGVPILFSWPSNGKIRAYLSDREAAVWSVPYMERFITELIDRSRVERLGLPLPLVENVDTIDASGIEVIPWSLPQRRACHASKQGIIADLVGLLRGHGPGSPQPAATVPWRPVLLGACSNTVNLRV